MTDLVLQIRLLEAAVARIRRLHPVHREKSGKDACPTCLEDYPCPTIRALDGPTEGADA